MSQIMNQIAKHYEESGEAIIWFSIVKDGMAILPRIFIHSFSNAF